jgi:hypothetical protein
MERPCFSGLKLSGVTAKLLVMPKEKTVVRWAPVCPVASTQTFVMLEFSWIVGRN